jgi:S-formylglutathione hydrolase
MAMPAVASVLALPAGAEVTHKVIPAPSLAGGLLEVPAEQLVAVYLPPSYGTTDRRYPVVYFLPGFGEAVPYFTQFGVSQGFLLDEAMNRLIGEGTVKEMIVVIPNGLTAAGGSFYTNSPVSGNWEDFIVRDVVGYVDRTYRTIPRAAARGLSGHSMGGTGALDLGMRHPDVFGAVYALSPGLFDSTGLGESPLFADRRSIEQFLKSRETFRKLSGDAARCKLIALAADLSFIRCDFTQSFTYAYGAAFAPDPSGPAPYFEYPYARSDTTRVRDERVWKRYERGFGDLPRKVQEYEDNLRRLRGLVIDYGDHDEYPWIPRGCAYCSRLLKARGIPHQLLSFAGGHDDQVRSRLEKSLLPFFSQTLAFE